MNKKNIFFENDGRMYRKEPFVKRVPRYTFFRGFFTGKFHSEKKNYKDFKDEFFKFKIYEGEVEIVEKSKTEFKHNNEDVTKVQIDQSQLPDKIFYFERQQDQKKYYQLNIASADFRNLKFIRELQQNEGEEAFGTMTAEFYGYVVDYIAVRSFKKRYRELHFIKGETKLPPPTVLPPIIPPIPTGGGVKAITKPVKTVVGTIARFYNKDRCLNNLLYSSLLTLLSLLIGFTPTFIIGLIWLLYVIYKCYFSYLRYLAYILGILFLIGLVYSIINTNWHIRTDPYIPKIVENRSVKPILVKEIKLLSTDGKNNDILIKRKMEWFSYSGEKYEGEYFIKKTELDQSREFKNTLSYSNSYESVLYQLQQSDKDKLGSLYAMFDKVQNEKKLSKKLFAEMIVSFVQQIPYYLVLEQSCNSEDYKEDFIKKLLKENPGMCSPNQRFGITSPIEFMANLQGDCDSRTLLLHTFLKHYNYDVIILSSDVYQHSMLGINLPYGGQYYNILESRYALWETTAPNFIPGNIPLQVSNMNNWYLTLK